jgi:Zn-dependent M16 (insulinase) family peptidase
MNFPRAIESIRRKWEANPELFQEIVRKWFLDNPHRLLSVMEPSKTYQVEQEEAFKKKMALLKASLSDDDLEKIRTDAQALKNFQAEPDAPAAASALPRLSIGDISRSIETIPTTKAVIENVPIMMHDIFANGIAYLDLAFEVSDVSEDLQPYLPLLAKLIVNMGAAGLDYEEMAKRIVLKTGGIGYHLSAGMTMDGRNNWQKLIFRVKALHRNIADAVGIISDILIRGDMSNETRMRELIAERKNDLHASVIPSGHAFARRSAGQALSIAAYRDEQWHGRTQLKFVNLIADEFNERKKELLDRLTFLQHMVLRKDRLRINLTADAEGLSLLRESAADFVGRLSGGGGIETPSVPSPSTVHAGIAIPAQVSYVAKVLAAPAYADPLSAPMFVLARELSSGYLYKHIRVQGGAYGGMSQYDPMSGTFALLSYRDPNIINTLNVYREAEEFISQNKISEEELEKTVIGTIGSLDKPMDPSSKGYIAMIRDFTGLTDADRLKFRHMILDITPELMLEAASRYFAGAADTAVIAVYSSFENLQKANEILEPKLKVETLI